MLAPTPGKELEPLPCAARTELNTIAERANIFAGARFDLVNTNQTGSPRLTFMLDYLRGGIRRTMVIYTKGR